MSNKNRRTQQFRNLRRLCDGQLRVRAQDTNEGEGEGGFLREVAGYASVTGVVYELQDLFGTYRERVAPTAFDRTLEANPEVVLTVNHQGLGLARTNDGAGSLRLSVDGVGLRYVAQVNTQETDASDLVLKVERGTVFQSSFAFRLVDWEWVEDDLVELREIDLHRGDVSVVTYGANPDTLVGVRDHTLLRRPPNPGAANVLWRRRARLRTLQHTARL